MFFTSRQKGSIPAASFERSAGIQLSNVSVDFESNQQKITVLSNVSAKLLKTRTAVLGFNGSGKSTLLKLINGLENPTSGTVLSGGLTVSEHTNVVRQKVGFLFANPAAQLVMPTPLEDVELSLRSQISERNLRTNRAMEILDAVGMGHRANHSVYDLSGGERQLIALATILAVEPEILLLDEPTTLLDLRNKYTLIKHIKSLHQQLIISTHDLELASVCDEAIVIHAGQIICQGSSDTVIEKYRTWCADGFPGEAC